MASGFEGTPDRPFKVRQSVPVDLLGFDADEADSAGAHSRVELGKNGSHPSALLAGMAKTDWGTELLDVAVSVAGAASTATGQNCRASVAIVTQKQNEVFMGC